MSSNPRGATTSRGGSRFYVWGRGERYWSVTTILGALPKDALKWWAARSVAEFAVDRSKTWFTMSREEAIDWLKREPLRFTAKRADVGSAIHSAIDAHVTGRPMPGDWDEEEERQAVGHFFGFLDVLEPTFLLSEAQVYNRSQKYAGTLDWVAQIPYENLLELAGGNADLVPWTPREGLDYVTILGDTKTGGDIAEGKGVYPEVALQLAAYGNAEFVGLGNGQEVPLPEVDGAAVLHVQAGGWRLVPVDALRPEVFRTFLYVREVFRWREVLSKEVLGQPLELVRYLPPAQPDTSPAAPVDDTQPPAQEATK